MVEKGIAFLIAFYFIYNAIVVSMIFLASVFSKPLMSSVEKRHFQEDDVVRDHTFNIVGYTLKDSVLYVLASLIAFPLLFIPVHQYPGANCIMELSGEGYNILRCGFFAI